MKRITKPKQTGEPALSMPKLEEQIEKIMKEKTPMPNAFSAGWYRRGEIDFLLRHQFRVQGMEFIPTLLAVLKTNGLPSARSSAARILGEIGSEHSIYLQAEEPLQHASKNDPSPEVRLGAKEAIPRVNQRKYLDGCFQEAARTYEQEGQIRPIAHQ
jgi:hypothetical protein